jgi:hypothetical protein
MLAASQKNLAADNNSAANLLIEPSTTAQSLRGRGFVPAPTNR